MSASAEGARPLHREAHVERPAPLVVCPPTSVMPSASSAARAPASVWYKVSSARAGSSSGISTEASAQRGVAPLAQRSLAAFTAATRPTR